MCDAALSPGEYLDPLVQRVLGGKYRLEAMIGEGSMGCVYAATHLALEKEIAVKVLHQHVAMDPKVAKRFHREARTASKLAHPNSLEIFDFGREEDGTLFIAMELLDGPDLLEVITDERPMSPARIVDVLGQVLRALEEAHDIGIVHRDLKPENIMVVQDHQGREHVKVCDFGIAKLVESDGSAITVTGFVCGTPEYIAPEQARGESLGARSDLYSLGCVLYQMLTGEVPFRAPSALGTITKHLTERVVPPRERCPELHIFHGLEAVCLRAMEKQPEARFPSAAEMRVALEDVLQNLGTLAKDPLGTHEQDPTAPPPKRSRNRYLVPALVASGLLFVGTAMGLEAYRDAPPPTLPEAAIGNPPVAARAQPEQDPPPPTTSPPADAGNMNTTPTRPMAPRSRATRPRGTTTARPRPAAMRPRAPTPSQAPPEPPSPEPSDFELGRQRFLANDVSGAIEAFERARRTAPRSSQVYKELGRAYMRAGDVRRAAAAYRRYLELAPSAPDRALVEQIIGHPSR